VDHASGVPADAEEADPVEVRGERPPPRRTRRRAR
jgi:hypothetical protein